VITGRGEVTGIGDREIEGDKEGVEGEVAEVEVGCSRNNII
jgi:uncharacterized protein YjbJ (UPF0337 family)